MRILLAFFLLIASVAVQAQNIRGNVSFEADTTAVPYATVALLELPDSALLTGVITLSDGGYLLEKVQPGEYFIKVSYVGYKPNGRAVTVNTGQAEVVVDTIYLAEVTTTLGEVTVVGERLKGKELVDRTVYAIPEVVSKSSSNGYDILKKIPQVNVDFQNNVTLNGSSNFIIQVDGRQRDKDFLARLLPSDIQSIEIITNPSGKYEGNIDGVISIILKKEARYGINGNVALSFKPFHKVTNAAQGSIDYSIGKATFYATATSIYQGLNISSLNDSRFPTIDSTTSMEGIGGIKVHMPSVNTGVDYYLNDKNNFSFNISYKPISQDVNLSGNTVLFKNSDPLNNVTSLTSDRLHSNETSFSLFYKRTFKKPVEEFTAETSYYIFRSDQKSEFANERHPYNSEEVLSSYSRLEDDLNHRNYFQTKLDYVLPVGMNTRIETGYQMYYQQMAYDFRIDDQQEDNLFEYAEFRNSVYGGITLNLKKIGFQAMLRIENSHITADSVTHPNYSCFLPSTNLQYKFSASHNLKFTYNRRINRPGIYNMNPYLKVGQNYSISQGNPDLRPDYRDRLQFTYTWNFGSNYFSPYVYNEFFKDKIGNRYSITTSPVDGSLTTITKPYNLLSGYEFGGGINAMLWYININSRIYKGHLSEYTEPSFSIPARDYFSYSVSGYAFANLDKKKTTTVFVYLSYSGVSINAQSKTYSVPLYGLGAQKRVKDNHNFGIFWLLPFSNDIDLSRTETETSAYSSTDIIGVDIAYFIQFSYSYRFNKGRNVKKINRKIEIESDSKGQVIGS
jgi:outer membrane receptor protein involved in Fe transport